MERKMSILSEYIKDPKVGDQVLVRFGYYNGKTGIIKSVNRDGISVTLEGMEECITFGMLELRRIG
jgi:transcription elongation factor